MTVISTKSITGVTSITSPQSDDAITLHTNDTTQRVSVTTGGINVTGVITATSFTSSGIVGLGTAAPGNPLHVYHATTNEIARFESGDATCYISFRDSASHATATSRPLLGAKTDDMFFQTGGSERLRIKSDGKVGISEDDPQALLHLNDGANSAIMFGNTTHGYKIRANVSGSNDYGLLIEDEDGVDLYRAVSSTGSSNTNTHTFFTAGSERLRIDSSGRLLYGKTSSTRETSLVLVGNSNSYATNPGTIQLEMGNTPSNLGSLGQITFGSQDKVGATISGRADQDWNIDSAHGTHIRFMTTANSSAANPTERLRIDSSGNVGVNNTNPAAYGKFVVTGTSNVISLNASSGAGSLSFFENGTGRFYLKTLNGSDGLSFVDADGSSERLRIDSSGRLLVGHTATVDTSTYNSKIQVMSDDAEASITVGRFGNNASSTSLNFSKSRATSIGSHSSGDLHDNDVIGNIFWWGSDGGDYEEVARISAEADAAFSTSSTPGALTFHTTASGATTATERLRIESGGNIDLKVAGYEADIYHTGSGDRWPLRLLNSDTTSGNMTGIYFGPCNNVAGAYISGKAEADFTSTANRDAGLEFGTRLNGNWKIPMVINATGYVTKPLNPYFHVQASPSITNTPFDNGLKSFSNIRSNNGSHYDNSTGVFTCPVAGFYFFSAGLWSANGDQNNGDTYALLYRRNSSGGDAIQFAGCNHHDQWGQLVLAAGYYCAVGDQIYVFYNGSTQGSTPRNYFSGCLIG